MPENPRVVELIEATKNYRGNKERGRVRTWFRYLKPEHQDAFLAMLLITSTKLEYDDLLDAFSEAVGNWEKFHTAEVRSVFLTKRREKPC